MKKLLNRIFIEGLSGMAYGLFATLIIGHHYSADREPDRRAVGNTALSVWKVCCSYDRRRDRRRRCLSF